jgi:site-specific DNA-methyltransferase (adenine-specific)
MDYENLVIEGACLDILRELPDDAFEAVVMDPPYGLGKAPTVAQLVAFLQGADLVTGDFMGAKWDIPSVLVWREVYRVLKPGGHVLSFGGTRTWDLISLGARAAGFEKRDTIADVHPALMMVHGMGFPKSLNVSKAIDKAAGAEREVVGTYRVGGNALTPTSEKGGTYVTGAPNSPPGDLEITAPATAEAQQFEGYGTALKPSWEPILVFRKPLEGTVVENVLKHGTGAMNIDGTRVSYRSEADKTPSVGKGRPGEQNPGCGANLPGYKAEWGEWEVNHRGRWPTNAVMTHAEGCKQIAEAWQCVEVCPVKALDEQSGECRSAGDYPTSYSNGGGYTHGDIGHGVQGPLYEDAGGASRFFPQFETPFFYTSKATKKEATLDGRIENNHPTKKPLGLMRWLVRLVCPKDGIVLDPYCGSGTTLHAAAVEGMRFTGIERDPQWVKTAWARMEIVCQEVAEDRAQRDTFGMMSEFDDD